MSSMWRSSCSRLQAAALQSRPRRSMLSDSSICHLRDIANFVDGNSFERRQNPKGPRPKRQTQIHPSSPLFRFLVEWFACGHEQTVFAGLSLGRVDVKPARSGVARRDGDARRHLALADVHGERTSRVKPTPARRGAQAWWCSAVLDVRRLRAVGVGRGREQELRDRKSTRLNSSHGSISYAVFCLKKKNCI